MIALECPVALVAQCITSASALAPPPSIKWTSQISPREARHPINFPHKSRLAKEFTQRAITKNCMKDFLCECKNETIHIVTPEWESGESSQDNALKLDTLSQSTARKMR